MTTRHFSRWSGRVFFSLSLTIPFFASHAAPQAQGGAANANVKTADGLTVVTFNLDPGTVTVKLPDDMRAGDTISGTVLAEAKGQTQEERATNQSVLNGLVVEIDGKKVEPFMALPKEREAVIQQTFWIYHAAPPNSGLTPPQPISRPMVTSEPGAVARFSIALVKPNDQTSGREIARAIVSFWELAEMTPSGAAITPNPKITVPTHPSGAIITPDPKITPTFTIPPLGQTGRPLVVTGPFDGNSDNTKLTVGGSSLTPLAESPRKVVIQSPSDVTGRVEVSVKEGDKETVGTFRNVKVSLTAPKTSLLKGESTELHVEVNGLEGLSQPVPLTLESHGVITMEGGNYQPLVIQPSQVGPAGTFTTTRGITGVQTGGWTATATVVTHRFDFCLQDDSNPQRVILINTFSGEYLFPQPGVNLGGSGSVIRKGCVFTLEHDAPDRKVMSTIDPCAHSGAASVQISPPKTPKVKFTITDRNTRDNTCAVN